MADPQDLDITLTSVQREDKIVNDILEPGSQTRPVMAPDRAIYSFNRVGQPLKRCPHSWRL